MLIVSERYCYFTMRSCSEHPQARGLFTHVELFHTDVLAKQVKAGKAESHLGFYKFMTV